MKSSDNIRNSIINKLLTISDKKYLNALDKQLNASIGEVKLSEEQIVMLKMSADDIKKGRLISQEQLDKEDAQWLKEL